MPTQLFKNPKVLLALVLGLIVLLGGIGFRKVQVARDREREASALHSAIAKLNTLDAPEVSKAIPDLETALKLARAPERKAQVKVLLARAYLEGEAPDRLKSVSLFKEVALDEGAPRVWRAIASQLLAEVADAYFRKVPLEDIYSGDPLSAFYQERNPNLALRRLWEWSDQLFPTVVPNYQIAHWYATQLAKDHFFPHLSAGQRSEYAQLASQRLRRADAIFARVPPNAWDNDRLFLSYIVKARTLAKLSLVSGSADKQRLQKAANEAFEKALDVAQRVYLPKGLRRAVPFRYAAFLAEAYGSARAAQIHALLQMAALFKAPAERDTFLVNYLTAERGPQHNQHYHKREILLLAKADPQFANLLRELGWREDELGVPVSGSGSGIRSTPSGTGRSRAS